MSCFVFYTVGGSKCCFWFQAQSERRDSRRGQAPGVDESRCGLARSRGATVRRDDRRDFDGKHQAGPNAHLGQGFSHSGLST